MSEGQTVRQRRDVSELPLFGPAADDHDKAEDLRGRRQCVFEVMQDGRRRTTVDATEECRRRFGGGFKESSVARYIRSFRDLEGWRVEHEVLDNGTYEYRLRRTE